MMEEADKNKQPMIFAIKVANIVFILGIFLSILLTVYAMYKMHHPPEYAYRHGVVSIFPKYYIVYILIGIIFTILFTLGLRLKDHLKVNLSLLCVTIGVFVYVFEIYLWLFSDSIKIKIDSQIDILNELRSQDIEAYLPIYPNVVILDSLTRNGFKSKGGKILPLGGIANITIVLNKEHGFYPIIEYDEHGFNNPKGLYNKNEVDIIITGDSFAEGDTVFAEDSIQAVLRKFGYNIISIGKGANGPLHELATIKEYAEFLRPKVVLWFYFENDIEEDLRKELKSSLLKRYLDDENFSQNLIFRQDEIDTILTEYSKNIEIKYQHSFMEKIEQSKIKKEQQKVNVLNNLFLVVKLVKLRTKMGLLDYIKLFQLPPSIPHPWIPVATTPKEDFKKILKKAKKLVLSWEGKMYFVYIPWKSSFYKNATRHPLSQYVMETAKELEIPVIDLYSEVLVHHHNPLLLFEDHFTPEGYKLVAEGVAKRLAKDGITSSN